jgi:hypothetical protein
MFKRLLVLFITLLSQFTVTAENWIVASAWDVDKVNTALSTWIWSFFNLLSDFSWVLIALLIFFVVLSLIKRRH